MRRLGSSLLVVGLLVSLASSGARADLKSAGEKQLRGDYASAIKDYKGIKGKEAGRAKLGLGRLQMLTGDYAGAEASAQAALKLKADKKDANLHSDAKVLYADVLRATGRYAEARKVLEEVVKQDPKHLRALCQLGLVYTDIGERDLASDVFNKFYDYWSDGTIDQDDAEQLMYTAIAMRYVENFQDANSTFQDAVQKDVNFLQANVEWGWLFLEKYSVGYAEQSFDEVLKIDANHPDAHAGMARVVLEQSYDVKAATEHVDKALAQNPRHAGALAIRATIFIDNNEYDAAEKVIQEIFATNPNDLDAHALLATIHWLKDDLGKYEAAKKATFAINPKFARFYHVIADHGVKEHRYKEAIALEQEAIKVDPRYYVALAEIGNGYLRLGDEKKGLEYLGQAWEGDRFNVRTYNILELFEGALSKDYVLFDSGKNFKFRMVKAEKAILERYVPRLLDKAFADMVKRYGFTPTLPVTIELYGNPDHYSVRTVGLPNLGALGVCFGQVITAISPSSGNVNWGMVLWHELGHVFAIQLSNSRVPRWFTEGLSEYETIIARPEWRRENDADIYAALSANKLPSVVELNSQFMRAKDIGEVVVAYHMSSVTIEFIVDRWGWKKIPEALKLFAKGKDTAQTIKAITGLDVAKFDNEFRTYLDKRLAAYKGTFRLRLQDFGDVTALEATAAAKPQDGDAHASLAVGYLIAEDPMKARASAEKALTIDGKSKKALYVLAQLAMLQGDLAAAKKRYGELINAGGDGYDVRMALAKIARNESDVGEVEKQLEKAKKLDPERSEPYAILSDLFAKNNREADSLKELERYVYIEQMDYAPVKKLVEAYSLKKEWKKVRELGEMALLINPYDAELHVTVGDGHLAQKKWDDAVYEYTSALASEPALKRPVVAHIGLTKAYVGKKDTKNAKKSVDAALKLEPKNAEALALKKQLSGAKPK